MLAFIIEYSPMKMKYQKSIIIENDKKKHTYNISDVHNEVIGILQPWEFPVNNHKNWDIL